MQTTFAQTGKFAVAAFCLLGATTVVAGIPGGVGSVSHSPLSSVSVPMLGGTGLVVLSALLAVVSLRFMKNRRLGGGHFLVLATLTGALAAGSSGIKLISDAQAGLGGEQVSLTLAGGGTVTILNQGYSQVVNGTGVTQKLTSISTAPGCVIGPINGGSNGGSNGGGAQVTNGGSFQGTCSDGSEGSATVLENLDTCEVLICCGVNGGSNGGADGCFNPV